MKYQAILFDLDGTLIDSAPDLVQTLNDMLVAYQRPQQRLDDLRPYVSQGSTKLLQLSFLDNYPVAFDELRQEFLTRYQQQNTVKTDFFEGITDVLDAIESSDTPWGIMTNKPTDCTLAIADKLRLNQRADAIVCGDTLPVAKPDPSPIILACKMIGVVPENCVYIGDCDRDIEAGQLAGMDTIACAYGYVGGDENINDWQADAIAHTPADILPLIQ